ncbi:MAG: hypothetical protein DBX55_08900 [Verrucomicrobia bacterium]|nr:MAG: hypothetical protein DBX55_08900 [Verrucomicrobiota bacterium]
MTEQWPRDARIRRTPQKSNSRNAKKLADDFQAIQNAEIHLCERRVWKAARMDNSKRRAALAHSIRKFFFAPKPRGAE